MPVDNFYEWKKTAAVKVDLNLGHRRSVKSETEFATPAEFAG